MASKAKALTQADMVELGRKLAAARNDPAMRCPVARTDAKGRPAYHLDKPRSRSPYMRQSGIDVSYGPHGVSFLAIDPTTGEVRCAACHDGVDATATPPPESAEAKAAALVARA